MEELRKDVECTTSTMMPTAMVAGHPHQVAAAAAVAASVLASRNAAAAAVLQNSALGLNLVATWLRGQPHAWTRTQT